MKECETCEIKNGCAVELCPSALDAWAERKGEVMLYITPKKPKKRYAERV